MRIPDIAFYNNFLKANEIKENKLLRYNNQLASGKKILAPSDAPVDAAKALRLKRLNQDIATYNRNMDLVNSILDVAESSLDNIVDISQEARVHIIQVLNTGVMDAEDANVLRDYFESVRNYILKKANVAVGDSRIFGGVNSQIDPFDINGNYQGEHRETKVPISKGVELNTTLDGTQYIGTVKTGLNTSPTEKLALVRALDDISSILDSGEIYKLHSYLSNMGYTSENDQLVPTTESGTLTIKYGNFTFTVDYDGNTTDATKPSTLKELVDAINNNPSNKYVEAFVFTDKEGVKRLGLVAKDLSIPIEVSDSGTLLSEKLGGLSTILDTFDKGLNTAMAGRSRIGTQISVIEDLKPQNEYIQTVFSNLASKLEDADYADVISQLEKIKTAYEALLASFNQNKDLSLLNFLK